MHVVAERCDRIGQRWVREFGIEDHGVDVGGGFEPAHEFTASRGDFGVVTRGANGIGHCLRLVRVERPDQDAALLR